MQEVAAMWGRSDGTIRNLFRNEKGVQHLIGPGVLLGTAKRSYDTITIPESVAQRVYERLKLPPVKVQIPRKELRQLQIVRHRKRRAV